MTDRLEGNRSQDRLSPPSSSSPSGCYGPGRRRRSRACLRQSVVKMGAAARLDLFGRTGRHTSELMTSEVKYFTCRLHHEGGRLCVEANGKTWAIGIAEIPGRTWLAGEPEGLLRSRKRDQITRNGACLPGQCPQKGRLAGRQQAGRFHRSLGDRE